MKLCPSCGEQLKDFGDFLWCPYCKIVICPLCGSIMTHFKDGSMEGFACQCGNFIFAEDVFEKLKLEKQSRVKRKEKRKRYEERVIVCPNCGFKSSELDDFILSSEGVICPRCGAVVLEQYAMGPEWREYSPEDIERRRGGEPYIRGLDSSTYIGGELISKGRDIREVEAKDMYQFRAYQAYFAGARAGLSHDIIEFVVQTYPLLMERRDFRKAVARASQEAILLAFYAYAYFGTDKVPKERLKWLAETLDMSPNNRLLLQARMVLKVLPKFLRRK